MRGTSWSPAGGARVSVAREHDCIQVHSRNAGGLEADAFVDGRRRAFLFVGTSSPPAWIWILGRADGLLLLSESLDGGPIRTLVGRLVDRKAGNLAGPFGGCDSSEPGGRSVRSGAAHFFRGGKA